MENPFKVAIASESTGESVAPYAILEAGWLMGAMVLGLKEKPWGMELQKPYPPYIGVWMSLGLLEFTEGGIPRVRLTQAGEKFVQLEDLFMYELSMLEQQASGNHVTDPEKYKKLRKALAKYSELYLRGITEELVALVDQNSVVVDYGGGSGYYLKQAMKKATLGHGVLIDKAPDDIACHNIEVVQHNFDDQSYFFDGEIAGTVDVVILSEVAHCLGPGALADTFENIFSLLKVGGKVIIIEQEVNYRLEQRLFDMTPGGTCYTKEELSNFAHNAGFDVSTRCFVDNSHFMMLATKPDNAKMVA